MSPRTSAVTNRLLDSLPARLRDQLLNQSSLADWRFGETLCEANQPYKHVYFPLTGFASLLTELESHHPLEMGLVGNEGMLGVSSMLGANEAAMQAVVQGSGTALSIPVGRFRRMMRESPGLSRTLLRYVEVLMRQLALAGACLHFHEIEARLARWLLMTQDRTQGDQLYLTHAFLAHMLGVRRSGVSLAAEGLQKRALISYSRGNIKVLDRKNLEAASCPCYRAMNASYTRIMG